MPSNFRRRTRDAVRVPTRGHNIKTVSIFSSTNSRTPAVSKCLRLCIRESSLSSARSNVGGRLRAAKGKRLRNGSFPPPNFASWALQLGGTSAQRPADMIVEFFPAASKIDSDFAQRRRTLQPIAHHPRFELTQADVG